MESFLTGAFEGTETVKESTFPIQREGRVPSEINLSTHLNKDKESLNEFINERPLSSSEVDSTLWMSATRLNTNLSPPLNSKDKLSLSKGTAGFQWTISSSSAAVAESAERAQESAADDRRLTEDEETFCGGPNYFVCCNRRLTMKKTLLAGLVLVVICASFGSAIGVALAYGGVIKK